MPTTRRQKQQLATSDAEPVALEAAEPMKRKRTQSRTRTKAAAAKAAAEVATETADDTAPADQSGAEEPRSDEPGPSSDLGHHSEDDEASVPTAAQQSVRNDGPQEEPAEEPAQSSLMLIDFSSDPPEEHGAAHDLPAPLHSDLGVVRADAERSAIPSAAADIDANLASEGADTASTRPSSTRATRPASELVQAEESQPSAQSSHESDDNSKQAQASTAVDKKNITHEALAVLDDTAPLIRLDSSPMKPPLCPASNAAGRSSRDIAERDEKITTLKTLLERRETAIRSSRSQLRRFATNLANTLTGDSAPPDAYGNAARTSGLFGRFSVGPGADTTMGSALGDADQSLLPGDLTVGAGGRSLFDEGLDIDYLADDVEALRVLWTEATQRFDFLRLEDHLRIQRLEKELQVALSSAQTEQSPQPAKQLQETETMKAQLAAARKTISEQAEELRQKSQTAEAQTAERDATLASQRRELSQLREELEVAQDQIEQVRKESDKLLDEEREASASILQATSKELDKLKDRNMQLEKALNAARTEAAQAAELQKKLDSAGGVAEQVQQLQTELVAAEEQIKELGDEKEKVERQIHKERSDLQIELEAAKTEKGHLQEQLAELERNLAAAQEKSAEVAKDLDNAQLKSAQLQSDLDAAEAKSAQLGIDIHTAQAKSTQLEQDLEAAQAKSAQLEKDLDTALSKSSHLEKDLEQAQKEAQQVRELQNQLQTAQGHEQTVEQLRAELDSVRQAVIKLEQDKEEQEQRTVAEQASSKLKLKEASEQTEALQARIIDLEAQLTTAQSNAAAAEHLREEVERAQEKVAEREREHAERLQREVGKNRDLEEELKHKENEMVRLRTQLASNDEMWRQAKEDSDRLTERLQASKHERDVLHRQMADMETELARSSKMSSSSQGTLDKLRTRNADLEALVAAKEREVRQMEDLKSQVVRLEEDLAQKVQEMLATMKEQKRLDARCKRLQAKLDQMTTAMTTTSSGTDSTRTGGVTPPPQQLPSPIQPTIMHQASVVRSPLVTSNSANTPLAHQVAIKSARAAVAAAATAAPLSSASLHSAAAAAAAREAKPPTPWCVAVALSSANAHGATSQGVSASAEFDKAKDAYISPSGGGGTARTESRKRSSPDDVAEAAGAGLRDSVSASMAAGAPLARAIYVPSPHRAASGFVPQRRSKTDMGSAAASSSSSSGREREVSGSSRAPVSATSSSALRREAAAASAGVLRGASGSSTASAAASVAPKLSAAERLAGRLGVKDGGGGGAASRVRLGGAGGGASGGGLSAQLAEVRARRAINMTTHS
ncbi:hypothetical protein OC834_000133 [Tilletia horrida]|nr:hypothetical protein OC834_000133 [Tilletia horrida]